MAQVTIRQGTHTLRVQVEKGTLVAQAMAQAGVTISQPCSGRGICGRCAVVVSGGVSAPNHQEKHWGVRLACQAIVEGDVEVLLPETPEMQMETAEVVQLQPNGKRSGIGASVDLGTTTMVLRLYDLSKGSCLGTAAMVNPQTAVSADVVGRMEAAMHGRSAELQQMIASAVQTMLVQACSQADVDASNVEYMVLTGNTAMLYLVCGMDPQSLSHAPFEAEHLFGEERLMLGRKVYLPRCMHAFVGADMSCAVLASGMLRKHEISLLCDVGTNGEMALWRGGRLYVTSVAAGPALEGAGISCGCGSVTGAIDRVERVMGRLHAHTIGDKQAVGLCGSGAVSAVACLLDMGWLDETGRLEGEQVQLAPHVTLTQQDIRAIQMAKAAIAAGLESVLAQANCPLSEVKTLYMAGGFGTHLSIPQAVQIGLIPPELAGKVQVIGNAALDGASMLLLNPEKAQEIQRLTQAAQHVELGGNEDFAKRYIRNMSLRTMKSSDEP